MISKHLARFLKRSLQNVQASDKLGALVGSRAGGCHDLKERALSGLGSAQEHYIVALPGRGSGLVAGAQTATLARDEVERPSTPCAVRMIVCSGGSAWKASASHGRTSPGRQLGHPRHHQEEPVCRHGDGVKPLPLLTQARYLLFPSNWFGLGWAVHYTASIGRACRIQRL